MKKLTVNKVSLPKTIIKLADDAGIFGDALPQPIDNLLWSENGYKPDVSFVMAYTNDSILLKYYVSEEDFKADYHHTNDPVYKDSCVEFFIAFGDDVDYYNLEFNALGTVLGGFGKSNMDRVSIDPALLDQIQRFTNRHCSNNKPNTINWELTLKIPFAVFYRHRITTLKGIFCRANFYKCGDDLARPHFLSWSPILHPSPNFHLPQYFGHIAFN